MPYQRIRVHSYVMCDSENESELALRVRVMLPSVYVLSDSDGEVVRYSCGLRAIRTFRRVETKTRQLGAHGIVYSTLLRVTRAVQTGLEWV